MILFKPVFRMRNALFQFKHTQQIRKKKTSFIENTALIVFVGNHSLQNQILSIPVPTY